MFDNFNHEFEKEKKSIKIFKLVSCIINKLEKNATNQCRLYNHSSPYSKQKQKSQQRENNLAYDHIFPERCRFQPMNNSMIYMSGRFIQTLFQTRSGTRDQHTAFLFHLPR